eukprot:9329588-Pyramimonas_sp.AAC.1
MAKNARAQKDSALKTGNIQQVAHVLRCLRVFGGVAYMAGVETADTRAEGARYHEEERFVEGKAA